MKIKLKEQIISFQKERDILFEKWYNSWDENNQDYMDKESDNKLDELRSKIYNLIKENINDLEVDFILENLTKLGDAPCLLYDDAGHFAITGDGYCSLVAKEPVDWEGQFWVKKEKWFNTIREALNNYVLIEWIN